MFALITLMPLRLHGRQAKIGIVLYVLGILIYCASWAILISFPNSVCGTIEGLVAPAYTPLIWLIGIGLIGNSFYFNIPFKRWSYFLVFLVFHNWHTDLIYFGHY